MQALRTMSYLQFAKTSGLSATLYDQAIHKMVQTIAENKENLNDLVDLFPASQGTKVSSSM